MTKDQKNTLRRALKHPRGAVETSQKTTIAVLELAGYITANNSGYTLTPEGRETAKALTTRKDQ